MSKRGPQLPRIQPVGRAALNPSHPHRDGDLAYIMENWPQRETALYVIESGLLLWGVGVAA